MALRLKTQKDIDAFVRKNPNAAAALGLPPAEPVAETPAKAKTESVEELLARSYTPMAKGGSVRSDEGRISKRFSTFLKVAGLAVAALYGIGLLFWGIGYVYYVTHHWSH